MKIISCNFYIIGLNFLLLLVWITLLSFPVSIGASCLKSSISLRAASDFGSNLTCNHQSLELTTKSKTAGKQQSLATVVKTAFKQNPQILKSYALTKISQAAIKEARSKFLPQVNISYLKGKENYQIAGNSSELNFTSGAITIQQPLFKGLGIYNLCQQRYEEEKSAKFNEKDTKENLALNITFVYLEILRLQELYQLTLSNFKAQKQIYSKIAKKVTLGAGHQADLELTSASASLLKLQAFSL